MITNKIRLTGLAICVLMVIGALVLTTPPANAELNSTSVVYAWDENQNKYQNSNVTVYWNGGWVPFLHQLQGPANPDNQFNTTAYVSATLGINTRWAGLMDYAVYRTDVGGAPGFRTTRRWSLVFCDRNNDQSFDVTERALPNPTGYYAAPYLVEDLTVIFQNVVTTCGTGNCQDQLVTRLLINLDKAPQDGVVDAQYRVGGVIGGAIRPICFYAEAQKPVQTSGTIWSGNIQGRVTDNGGDKTVNFSPQFGSPTAVKLSSFGTNASNNHAAPDLVIPGLTLGFLGLATIAGIWKFGLRRA